MMSLSYPNIIANMLISGSSFEYQKISISNRLEKCETLINHVHSWLQVQFHPNVHYMRDSV